MEEYVCVHDFSLIQLIFAGKNSHKMNWTGLNGIRVMRCPKQKLNAAVTGKLANFIDLQKIKPTFEK